MKKYALVSGVIVVSVATINHRNKIVLIDKLEKNPELKLSAEQWIKILQDPPFWAKEPTVDRRIKLLETIPCYTRGEIRQFLYHHSSINEKIRRSM